ncbi:hypothetical protein SAMN04489731_13522 [Amycolatopsis regifaucium]|nr:hypothetical protein SAMN04489731_13522 [Amycolatopsis regifaucium]
MWSNCPLGAFVDGGVNSGHLSYSDRRRARSDRRPFVRLPGVKLTSGPKTGWARRRWRARGGTWWWAIVVIVVPVALIAAGAVTTLLLFIDPGSDAKNRIELIKVGLTVGAGTGGVVALVLTGRRQWSTEHDNTERRSTKPGLSRRLSPATFGSIRRPSPAPPCSARRPSPVASPSSTGRPSPVPPSSMRRPSLAQSCSTSRRESPGRSECQAPSYAPGPPSSGCSGASMRSHSSTQRARRLRVANRSSAD